MMILLYSLIQTNQVSKELNKLKKKLDIYKTLSNHDARLSNLEKRK